MIVIVEMDIGKAELDIKSWIENFYLHCLKWAHLEMKQSKSWANTIIDSSKFINITLYDKSKKKHNKSVINKFGKDRLFALYQIAMKRTNIVNIDDLDQEDTFKEFDSIQKIYDTNIVKNWLIDTICKNTRDYDNIMHYLERV